ncbi:hypothetical protein [Atopobacter sp. AH10]|nr:hypothetical protein [Atopobacter sp. AH10]
MKEKENAKMKQMIESVQKDVKGTIKHMLMAWNHGKDKTKGK